MVSKADYITVPLTLENFIEAIKRYNDLSVLPADLEKILDPGDTPETVICKYAVRASILGLFKRAAPATGRETLSFDLRIGNVRIDVRNTLASALPDPVNDAIVTANRTNNLRHAYIFTRMVYGMVDKQRKPFLPPAFTFANKVNFDVITSLAMKMLDHYKTYTIIGFVNLKTFMEGAKHRPVGYTDEYGRTSKFETFEKPFSSLTPIMQVVYHYETITGHKLPFRAAEEPAALNGEPQS